jgi:hypothetical protein
LSRDFVLRRRKILKKPGSSPTSEYENAKKTREYSN